MSTASPTLLSRRRLLTVGGAVLAAPGKFLLGAAASRVVQDGAGRRVEVPVQVRRVFASGKPAAVLLASLAPESLLGWSRPLTPEEKALLSDQLAALPETGILAGRSGSASSESVLALRPDLIVDYGSVKGTSVSLAERTQEQTRIPYLLIDGPLSGIPRAYSLLGEALGVQERAAGFATFTRDVLSDARSRVEKVSEAARPRVYFARGPRGLETGLAGSINVEAFEALGITTVAGRELGRGNLVTVSVEQVLAWNPEVIVATDPAFARSLVGDPVWRSVAAVRKGRVHVAPVHPFGWVDSPPSVNRLIGVRWLGSILFPKEFPEDLRPFLRDFHARFYHRSPTEAQLTALLASSSLTARP